MSFTMPLVIIASIAISIALFSEIIAHRENKRLRKGKALKAAERRKQSEEEEREAKKKEVSGAESS